MSYILEALKKAQAERQLGSTPTVHASQLHLAGVAGRRPSRVPVVASVAVAVLALAAAVAFYLRPPAAPAPQPAPVAVAPQSAPPTAASQSAVPAAAPHVVPAASPPQPLGAQAMPAAVPPPPAGPVRSASAPAAPPARAPVVAVPSKAAQSVAAPSRAASAAFAQEHIPLLRELPNGGAGIPKVELGGYIYSDNPADRLVVIDKELRKEGDEVAPGLLLEKLGPAEAVMNYRGTRFRIPY